MAVNFEALGKMTTEQLRELNEGICMVLRQRQTDRQRDSMRQFKRNDHAVFRCSRTGRLVNVRIDKFNTKTVGCTELDGSMKPTNRTWRVHPSLLHPIHE